MKLLLVICYPGAKVHRNTQSCNYLKEKDNKKSLFATLSCISKRKDAYCCSFVSIM